MKARIKCTIEVVNHKEIEKEEHIEEEECIKEVKEIQDKYLKSTGYEFKGTNNIEQKGKDGVT